MGNPEAKADVTLLDACAVLSLFATGRMGEILLLVVGTAAIVDLVAQEALYVRRVVEGEVVKEPVVLGPLVESGRLTVITTDTEAELLTFIDLAVDLDDGEAMSAAIALHRNFVLVTDDKKVERLLAGRVRLRPTLNLIKAWADAVGAEPDSLREVLALIDERGYQPAKNHPYRQWWDAIRRGNARS